MERVELLELLQCDVWRGGGEQEEEVLWRGGRVSRRGPGDQGLQGQELSRVEPLELLVLLLRLLWRGQQRPSEELWTGSSVHRQLSWRQSAAGALLRSCLPGLELLGLLDLLQCHLWGGEEGEEEGVWTPGPGH